MTDEHGQAEHPDPGLERALARALKFNAVDLAANRKGHSTGNQRLRFGVRGFLVLVFAAIFATLPSVALLRVQSSDVAALKLVLLILLVELPVLLLVASRGLKMLMDAFSDRVTVDTGTLQFGVQGDPACSAHFIYDVQRVPNLSWTALLVTGFNAYLIEWTREPADRLIRLRCGDVGRRPRTRRCVAYHSRWTRRPLAIELGPTISSYRRQLKGERTRPRTTKESPPVAQFP
jgi:hypothetical protein